jgi:hypothetical protein
MVDNGIEYIEGRESAQCKIQVYPPDRVLKTQNETRVDDPKYNAIPFFFAPPPTIARYRKSFETFNQSQIQNAFYRSAAMNKSSNSILSRDVLNTNGSKFGDQLFDRNRPGQASECKGIDGQHRYLPRVTHPNFSAGTINDLESNYFKNFQSNNLNFLNNYYEGRIQNRHKSHMSRHEHSPVAKPESFDYTRLMSHQDLYEISNSEMGYTKDQKHLLYMMESDERHLSEYQCLIRKHIEYFEAGEDDIKATIQGRNKPIVLMQVGVRCCFCSKRAPQHRTRGSTYYPTTLQGLYQACQNLASVHLCENCPLIPESLMWKLLELRTSKSLLGGGKRYWANSARLKGIDECNGVLVFKHTITSST